MLFENEFLKSAKDKNSKEHFYNEASKICQNENKLFNYMNNDTFFWQKVYLCGNSTFIRIPVH